MKRKHITTLTAAAVLLAVSVTGCAGNKPAAEPTGTVTEAPTTAPADISLTEVLDKIKEAYGENYAPQSEMDETLLNDLVGISPDLYDSYVAEMPLISTFVETFIGIEAKDGKGDEVEKLLNEYRDRLVNDTMQYPMNVAKIQASQVVRHGNYVFFVMLGAADDAELEKGDEEAIKSALENNQIALDVIDGFFQ